ncbi:MAG: transposase family protein [Sphingomonas sp.]|nr:transposase family protein [Sphingomonas sp.]
MLRRSDQRDDLQIEGDLRWHGPVLAVVDDFTCKNLALVVDKSKSGAGVARELDAIIAVRGRPTMMVSDNGTELMSLAILRWAQDRQIEWHYIAPGKPQQNG